MKKNLVVIGYGGMGSWHVGHAQKSDVVNLAGIYDIDPAKSELAKSRDIFAYDSLEAVLADEKVDIYICFNICTYPDFLSPGGLP